MNKSQCFIITGGPCAGKTTTINLIKDLGHNVKYELGTEIIKEGILFPYENRHKFQMEIYKRRKILEESIKDSDEIFFLERGYPDGEAYYLIDNLQPPDFFNDIDLSHYKIIFLLEELPFFENNGVRWENIEFSRKLNQLLFNCYLSHNLKVYKIPFSEPNERVKLIFHFIIKHFPELKFKILD